MFVVERGCAGFGVGRRFAARLRSGDLLLIFVVWYSVVRFGLEYLRAGYDWTFFGVPTAQLVAVVLVAGSLCLLACESLGGYIEACLPVALAVELVHNFSLIHDDIEDSDRRRYGRSTLQEEGGIPVAINTGGIASFAAIWLVVIPLEAALSASRRVVAFAAAMAIGSESRRAWLFMGISFAYRFF